MRCLRRVRAQLTRGAPRTGRGSGRQSARHLPRGRLSLSPRRSWPRASCVWSLSSVCQAASTPSSTQRRRRFSNARRNRASGVRTSKILLGPRSTGYAASSSRTCEISITGTRSYAVRIERGRPSNSPQVTSTCVGVTRTIAICHRLPGRRTFVLLDRIEHLFQCQHLRRVCGRGVPATLSLVRLLIAIDDWQTPRIALERRPDGGIQQTRFPNCLRPELAPYL